MAAIHSRNSVWRVWNGSLKTGKKGNRKKVGVTVSISIRLDKLPATSEEMIINDISDTLRKHAVIYDPE